MKTTWYVEPSEHEMPVIVFLQNHLAEQQFSRRRIKSFIDSGLCSINDRIARKCQVRVLSKQLVTLILPQKKDIQWHFSFSRVLYEDDNIFAYDKPAGISCEPKGIGAVLGKERSHFQLVHRLDKDTSGVLLFAKNEKTHTLLLEQFRERTIHKKYLALVDGAVHVPSGTIEKRLAPQRRLQGRVLWGVAREGSYARTDWKVCRRASHATLVELVPHTGKTHQLRVHMQSLGHPIVGDTQYGSSFQCRYEALRQMLHAQEVAFKCPLSQKDLHIVSPIPEDMGKAINSIF